MWLADQLIVLGLRNESLSLSLSLRPLQGLGIESTFLNEHLWVPGVCAFISPWGCMPEDRVEEQKNRMCRWHTRTRNGSITQTVCTPALWGRKGSSTIPTPPPTPLNPIPLLPALPLFAFFVGLIPKCWGQGKGFTQRKIVFNGLHNSANANVRTDRLRKNVLEISLSVYLFLTGDSICSSS